MKTFIEELESIEPESFMGLILEAKDYDYFHTELVKFFTGKDLLGLYVTVNKLCKSLEKQFIANGIEDQIFYIDTETEISKEKHSKRCLFNVYANDLTALSININKSLQKHRGIKFVVFDSLSSLLVHNSSHKALEFINFVIKTIKNLGMFGILIILKDKKSNEVIPQITLICDKIIFAENLL